MLETIMWESLITDRLLMQYVTKTIHTELDREVASQIKYR